MLSGRFHTWLRRLTNPTLGGLLSASVVLSGCFGPGLLTDGTTVSGGTFNHGFLRGGVRLPPKGAGYVIPQLWQDRGANYTTDEFASALQKVAARVAKEHPGSVLGIADLSLKGGGESALHRSHQNGRDADLIFYAVRKDGKPTFPGNYMPRYDAKLVAKESHPTTGVVFEPTPEQYFDVKRNWALVRALLQERQIEVQYLFCHNRLRKLLLDYARAHHEREDVIERAEAVLRQPGDSLPHDDHLHVRIYCAANDRLFGCQDSGPLRWWKKLYKYMPPERDFPTSDSPVARLLKGGRRSAQRSQLR